MKNNIVMVVVLVFIILSGGLFALGAVAPDYKFLPLEAGNVIIAALSIASWFMIRAQVSRNPHAFVRGVSSASFLKMMVCMISVLAYILIYRKTLYKPSVFVLMGVYGIYTVLETRILWKTVKTAE